MRSFTASSDWEFGIHRIADLDNDRRNILLL